MFHFRYLKKMTYFKIFDKLPLVHKMESLSFCPGFFPSPGLALPSPNSSSPRLSTKISSLLHASPSAQHRECCSREQLSLNQTAVTGAEVFPTNPLFPLLLLCPGCLVLCLPHYGIRMEDIRRLAARNPHCQTMIS